MSPTLAAVLLFVAWCLATVMYVVAADEHKIWITVFVFGSFLLLGVFGVIHEANR